MSVPNRLETMRNLRVANLDMAFASAFGTLVGGAFLVGFIKAQNGSDLWIGLLTAIPSVLGIAQIPGAVWGASKASYKAFVLPGGLLWRLFYAPFIVLPFLPIEPGAKLVIAMTCALAAALSTFLVNPVYNDWLAQMVPTESRGAFFSLRNAIATGVGGVVGIVGGLVLDAFERARHAAAGYSTVFALGFAASMASFAYFLKMKDLPRERPAQLDLWQGMRAFVEPFRDHGYRPVLVFLAFATLGQGFAGSLFFAYGIETLRLPFTVLQLAGAAQAMGTILSAGFWGFASDKYGNKPMLAISGLLLAINPIPWALCRPGDLAFDTALLLCAHVVFGVLWGGVNLCQFNILLSTSSEEDRGTYLGAGMAVTALVGGVSPMLGATLMALLRPGVGAREGYVVVFLATAALRAFAVLWLARVREAGSTEVRTALQHFRSATPSGVRAMRRLTRGTDSPTREAALEQLGDEGFALAADEIVKALADPLPGVRRQAARAVMRLDDFSSRRAAAGALIARLEAHPDLVEEEMVEALGSTRDLRALRPLTFLLQSPRSLVRRAAARALGRLGAMEAMAPLTVAAQSREDPDLRRVALQALRLLGARDASAVFGDAVADPRAAIRVAAAEGIAELEMLEAAPQLRKSLAEFPDEGADAVAYALGVVGEPEDAGPILAALAELPAGSSRRQGLLGVARLFGVERRAYRLMLLDGMERDAALVEALKAARRRHRGVDRALEAYVAGEEAEGLRRLAQLFPDAGLAALAERPVRDAFLVAAALLERAVRPERG